MYVENTRIYPFTLHENEVMIAKELKNHLFEVESVDVESKIKQVEFSLAITYDGNKDAIQLFFDRSFMILTGGPGTGKTTTVKGIWKFVRMYIQIVRFSFVHQQEELQSDLPSNCDSRTIHSLLQWNLEDNSLAKMRRMVDIDFIIVDEFDMVDTHLLPNY